MALNVETGSGSSTSDSYVGVPEADTYHVAFTAGTTWSSAAIADKERALRKATQFIDTKYGSSFRGRKALAVQSLQWPRVYVTDADGFDISSTTVPTKLRHAVCEAALRALSSDLVVDETPGELKRTLVRLGPITEELEYTNAGQDTQRAYVIVDDLLQPLIEDYREVQRA